MDEIPQATTSGYRRRGAECFANPASLPCPARGCTRPSMASSFLMTLAGDGKISFIGRDSGRPRSRRFVVSPSRRAAALGVRSLRFCTKEEIPMYHVPN